MPQITDIRPQKKRQDRVNIFIDGAYALALDRLSAHDARLEIGQEVSEAQLSELLDRAGLDSALSVALRYLTARPRSERELRTRLRQRNIGEAVIDRTVEQSEGTRGLLDDFTFAQYWVDQRVTFRPRSRRMLEMELRQKGVNGSAIEDVTLDMDDEAEAYRAAQRRARTLSTDDFDYVLQETGRPPGASGVRIRNGRKDRPRSLVGTGLARGLLIPYWKCGMTSEANRSRLCITCSKLSPGKLRNSARCRHPVSATSSSI